MTSPTFIYERVLMAQGYTLVAGVDEVGCGAWAGPVYAAAVILKPGTYLPGVRDSKTLSVGQRQELVTKIKAKSVAWAIGTASVEEIASLNIRRASALATKRALAGLVPEPQWILSDAFPIDGDIPCTPIIHGDALCKSIAAASILAKVTRDELMRELDKICPGYSFGVHKGYGTKAHQQALTNLGPSPLHRMTYAPIKKFLTFPSFVRRG